MASECCANAGIHAKHHAKGSMQTIAGTKTYVTGNSNDGKAVIVCADIFGAEFINVQKQADEIAAAGFTVYVPDEFSGNAFDPHDSKVWDKLGDWLKSNGPDGNALKVVKALVEHLSQDGNTKSIQMVGNCYGAKPIVLTLGDDKLGKHVKAVVFNHPSFLEKSDVDKVHIPIHINEAENDHIFTPELREHWEKALKEKNLGTFKQYAGTEHGFTVRPGNEKGVETQKEATKVMIDFLKSHA